MNVMGDFIYSEAKPLPVILLLDTSGSMSINDNIGTLNRAVREMLRDFKKVASSEASISVAIITFGEKTGIYTPLTDVNNISEDSIAMTAYGMTPLGQALTIAKQMVEDRNQIPSRAYRPTIVLVTDGAPNDDWEKALDTFMNDGRSAKCYRMAMGIGAGSTGPSYNVLKKFVSSGEKIFSASDANGISKFFRYVTISTTSRANSSNPNVVPPAKDFFAPKKDENEEEDDGFGDLLPF